MRVTNVALRFFDSMLTSAVRSGEERPWAHLRSVFARRTRHFDRPAAALSFLNALLPGTRDFWLRLVLRVSRLPLRGGPPTPLAHGNGTTVYAFDAPSGRFVYKVQRDSLGLPLPALRAFAEDRLRKFRGVLRHYGPVAEVFPPSHFLIAHGPLLNAAAVVTLQPMISGPTRDLLDDFDDEQLERLLESQPRLRRQVAAFAARTIVAWEGGARWIVDLGRNNLLLVGAPHDLRLIYLDAEMLEVSELEASPRAPMYDAIVDRMRSWQAWLGDVVPEERRPLGAKAH